MAPDKKSSGLFASFKSKSKKDKDAINDKTKAAALVRPASPKHPASIQPVVRPQAPTAATFPKDATKGIDVVKAPEAAPKVLEVPKMPEAAPKPVTEAPAKSSLFAPAKERVTATKVPVAEPALEKKNPLLKADAVAAWQPRPRLPSRLMDTYVNFMVLGESGLGKTTFIKNLTANYDIHGEPAHDGSSTSLKQFQSDPYALRTVLEPMDIPESSRRLMMSVQDMPGWGDDINLVRYLRIVTDFLLDQRQKDYEKLNGSRAMSSAAMCGQLQHSVTACLYFIAPHRMKKIDLILMAAVSQLTSVIPVIGKSDTMTEGELSAYRAEVMGMLKNPSKYVDSKSLPQLQVSLFRFAEQVLNDLGVEKAMMPVAIVTSRDTEAVTDTALLSAMGVTGPCSQPVRRYKWGDCYPLNRNHSDLILLKRLLLGDRVDSLYAMLDDSYLRYVQFCTTYEEAGKQLQLVVHDYCNLTCPHLEYDDYAKAKKALESAKLAMSALSEENKTLAERLSQSEKERKALADRLRAFA